LSQWWWLSSQGNRDVDETPQHVWTTTLPGMPNVRREVFVARVNRFFDFGATFAEARCRKLARPGWDGRARSLSSGTARQAAGWKGARTSLATPGPGPPRGST